MSCFQHQAIISPRCFKNDPVTLPQWANRYPDQPDLLPPDEYVLCSITSSLVSPLEFALVPKELDNKVVDVQKQLVDFDMNYAEDPNYVKKLCQGTPCYVNCDGCCRRARVEMVGNDDVLVSLVDIGQTAYVNKIFVKRLPMELPKLAPSAYICAIKSVDSRELFLATRRRFAEVMQPHKFVAVRSRGIGWHNRLLVDIFDSRLKNNLSVEFQTRKTKSLTNNLKGSFGPKKEYGA